MTNKKLYPDEILRALANGKYVQNINGIYYFNKGHFFCLDTDKDNKREYYEVDISCILSFNCTIYNAPEKPKKLSELFLQEFKLKLMNGKHLYKDSIDFNTQETLFRVYDWLKEQEDEN